MFRLLHSFVVRHVTIHFSLILVITGLIIFSINIPALFAQPGDSLSTVGWLGEHAAYDSLNAEEKAAYDWLDQNYDPVIITFEELKAGDFAADTIKAIWWHLDQTADLSLPDSARDTLVTRTLYNYVEQGNGLYLSGFAPQYVVDLGVEDTEPQEIRRGRDGEPESSGEWGYYQLDASHPIFKGFTNPFAVLSSGLEVNNNICWWTQPSTFDGTWLGDTEWESGSLVLLGEYELGEGSIIVNGAGAYEWDVSGGTNSNRNNLEKFTDNIIRYLGDAHGPGEAPEVVNGLIANFPLNEGEGNEARETVTSEKVAISNNFNKPEWKPGVTETALRLDGFSTWISTSIHPDIQPIEEITVELWTAIKAYPVSNAAYASNYTPGEAGYNFGLGENGHLFFTVYLDEGMYRLEHNEIFPKNEWVHAGATFSKEEGMKLYLDGREVASKSVPSKSITPDSTGSLYLGRDSNTPMNGIFPTGVMNALIDEVSIYNRAWGANEMYSEWSKRTAPEKPDFAIPESRFTHDKLYRPDYHSMPPSNWTNEPHGLVEHKGNFHLFYQNNPNGPYWGGIHWGHVMSPDLVSWKHMPIALAPILPYEQHGIWSGDVVVHDGVPTAVYTAVDGASAQMALAMSGDSLKEWNKYDQNPVILGPPAGFQDFRDPYLWQEGDTWYAIIGDGKQGGAGSLPLYKSQDLKNWEYLHPLYTGQDENEVGTYWEMPVFEPIGKGLHVLMVNTVPTNPAKLLYWIGKWENEKFTPIKGPIQLDPILHLLSPSVVRMDDGELVGIGIPPDERNGIQHKNAGWAHAYSLPREFYLQEDSLLGVRPYTGLEKLRKDSVSYESVTLNDDSDKTLEGISGRQLEVRAQIDPGSAEEVGLTILKSPGGQEFTRIYYNTEEQEIHFQRDQSSTNPSAPRHNRSGDFKLKEGEDLDLRIYIDHAIVEVFLNGREAFVGWVYPTMESSEEVELYVKNGEATVKRITAWEVNDAFKTPTGMGSLDGDNAQKPSHIELFQNYPNPFNPVTTIAYSLSRSSEVTLSVYDINGRKVSTLIEERHQNPGMKQVQFSSANLSSGIYFYQLKTPKGSLAKPMTLIK